MAPKWIERAGILPSARTVEAYVRSLDEASHQQGRSPPTCGIPAGIAPGRAPSTAGKERQRASEMPLCGEHGHALARPPGVLGDACGGDELERDERARLCGCAATFAYESAQVVRPAR